MSLASERIQAILMELDADTKVSEKSAGEIADILLQRKAQNEPKTKQQESFPGTDAAIFDMAEMEVNLHKVNSKWQLSYYREIENYGRGMERIVVFAKRLVRKLIRFVVEPIVRDAQEFHAAVTRTLNAFRNNDIAFDHHIRAVEAENRQQEERIRSLTSSVQTAAQNTDRLSAQLEEQRSEVELLRETVSELREELEAKKQEAYLSLDYFDFENHFRGSRAQVKEMQKMYIHHYADCRNVLDLGSGRGEFLELLAENHIPASGVDLYAPFVDYCRTRGFNVAHEDAVRYLLKQPDAAFDGIFASQLAEHLSAQDLLLLCRESYRVLEEGKTLIIETPNPTCMATYMNSFYMDPTHVKPVHPKTLEYLLKSVGFRKVDVVYTQQSRVGYRLPLLSAPAENLAEFNDGVNFVSDIIFGSQDYAMIAVK